MRERLTSSDVEKIEAEIQHRILVVRKEALEDVKEARAHGDLSENFEYKAAKQFKNQNESRIRYLQKVLKFSNVISHESNPGQVGINKEIGLYFVEDDEIESYKLVTSIRANSTANIISIESPLGSAINGKYIGDRVTVKINENANYDVIIKNVSDMVDDSFDELRRF